MFKAAKLNTLLQYALCLLAFSIPTKFILSSLCLALVAILWLLKGNMLNALKNLKKRKGLWPWFLMYGLLIVSYFYSENKDQSAFDLKTKLACLILPLIVGAGINILTRRVIENIFVSLIGGVAVAAVISLVDATLVWYPDNYYDAFFYHHLVRLVDPNAVYMAWYTIFSIALLLFMPWQYHFQNRYKILRVIAIAFLTFFFILLSARMFMLLFLIFVIPYFLKRSFANWRRGIVVTILTLASLYGFYHLVSTTYNPIRNRYNNMINRHTGYAWVDDYSNVPEEKFDNMTLRLFLWRIGIESVADRNAWFTGVGNGDVHVVLTDKMRELKIQNIDNPDINKRPGFYHANLHNMFVQTLVMIGIPGLLLMMWIAFVPVFFIHKLKPYQPFLVFHITSLLFMMQEAVLQTQAGIFFYILISSMFWGMYYNEKKVRVY